MNRVSLSAGVMGTAGNVLFCLGDGRPVDCAGFQDRQAALACQGAGHGEHVAHQLCREMASSMSPSSPPTRSTASPCPTNSRIWTDIRDVALGQKRPFLCCGRRPGEMGRQMSAFAPIADIASPVCSPNGPVVMRLVECPGHGTDTAPRHAQLEYQPACQRVRDLRHGDALHPARTTRMTSRNVAVSGIFPVIALR